MDRSNRKIWFECFLYKLQVLFEYIYVSYNNNTVMGGFFGKLFSKLVGKKELKIIIIGLDNSGKTTILSISLFM